MKNNETVPSSYFCIFIRTWAILIPASSKSKKAWKNTTTDSVVESNINCRQGGSFQQKLAISRRFPNVRYKVLIRELQTSTGFRESPPQWKVNNFQIMEDILKRRDLWLFKHFFLSSIFLFACLVGFVIVIESF